MNTGHVSISHIAPVKSASGMPQPHVQEHSGRSEDTLLQQNGLLQAQTESQAVSKEKLAKAVEGINQTLEITRTHLKFKLHEELHEYYVQVINEQTQEVIKEIPPKKFLDIVAEIWKLAGILINEKR